MKWIRKELRDFPEFRLRADLAEFCSRDARAPWEQILLPEWNPDDPGTPTYRQPPPVPELPCPVLEPADLPPRKAEAADVATALLSAAEEHVRQGLLEALDARLRELSPIPGGKGPRGVG